MMKLTRAKKNKDKIISKPRKAREYKPKNVLPDAFYETQRHGYAYCGECKDYSRNALKGNVLTCQEGHTTTLLVGYSIPSKKEQVARRKLDRAIKNLNPDLFLI